MNIKINLRRLWHDLYYRLTGRWGANFALRCRQVAESVDFRGTHLSMKKRFQIFLHLSLCRACRNYSDYSTVLHKLTSVENRKNLGSKELDRINERLIKDLKK